MAVVNTGLAEPGLRSEFFKRFAETQSVYDALATRIGSNKDKETFKFLGSIPVMRAWGTGRKSVGLRTESYDVVNEKYESTIEVDRSELEDDQTEQIRLRIGEMASRAALHKDYLIAQLIINGDQSGYNSYDGVPFFDDAHVSGSSGSQDNKLTSSASAPSAPTVAEFKTAVAGAIAAMLAFKDDVGQPMSMGASGLVAVVPPSMYVTALEALSATLIGSTSNVLQGAARVLAFPWLSTATKWYLLKTDGHIRPFVFIDRTPVEFKAMEQDSESGFMRDKFLYGVRARYAMTYGYWQYAVQTTFT